VKPQEKDLKQYPQTTEKCDTPFFVTAPTLTLLGQENT